jgi:LysM repeat protein
VVAKGETPSSIAHKYKVKLSDLYSWNGWGKNVVLQIGQKVTIQKK